MFLCVLYSVLMVQSFVLQAKPQSTYQCSNISLVDLNETVPVSTLAGNGTAFINGGTSTDSYFCWNITTHDWWQIQATCQYRQTVSDSMLHLYLSDKPNLPHRLWSFFGNYIRWNPVEIYSSGILLMFARISNQGTFMTCEIRPVTDKNAERLCGPQNISLTDQRLISVSIPGNHLSVQCLWLITSPSEAIVFVDVLNVNLHYNQRFVFGQGHNSANESTVFGEINNSNEMFQTGSSLFSIGAYLWITFTSSLHNDENNPPTQQLLLRIENYTGTVRCKSGQFLCQEDSKCIPLQAFCDGEFHCSNHIDEAGSCDRCGKSDIDVQFGEVLTISSEFEFNPAPGGPYMTGYFAIYTGDSGSRPNTTLSDNVIVSSYTEGVSRLSCVWRLTEPEGTRIHITVAECSGDMRIRNGRDTTSTLTRVINSISKPQLPMDILSIDSGVWITWEIEPWDDWHWHYSWDHWDYWDYSDYSEYPVYLEYEHKIKLKLLFTAYNIRECEEGQFSCPSGLDCLDDTSKVCDGRKECTAYGDEINCGVCGQHEFRCGMTDSCVPRHQICDRKADCRDYSDEMMCGFCGNETVHLSTNNYVLRHDDHNTPCMWVITAEPGWRIEARIQQLDKAFAVTIGTSYDTTSPVNQKVLREVIVKSYYAYPRFITTNNSIMWIKAIHHRYHRPADELQIDFHQYRNVECSQGEHTCASGLQCIPEEARCDGTAECPEFGDEINCGNCSKHEFPCRLGYGCVSLHRVCDGRNDCPDLSDEMGCGPCDGSFYNLSGGELKILTSPGWPLRNYPPYTQCLWLLVAEAGYRIVLYFEEFFLEKSFDFLYCGNGDSFNNAFLRLSGNRFPIMVASTNNTMFVRFTSDFIIQERGFQLKVQQKLSETVWCGKGEIPCKTQNLICIRNSSKQDIIQICRDKIEGCGGVIDFSGNSTDLRSPGYPQAYPPDVACHWEIKSTERFLISIVSFATETSRDILRFEGTTPQDGKPVFFKMDGSTKFRTIEFCSLVRINFTTDSTVEDTGFLLRLLPTNNDTSCIDEPHDDCGPCMCPDARYEFQDSQSNQTDDQECQDTPCLDPSHFDCGDGSCVSPNATCDEFQDCQMNELDEQECQNISCSESYHCQNSSKCVHWPLVCDGKPDCPMEDDEADHQCGLRCPGGCKCDIDEGSIEVECKHGWNESTLANVVKRTKELKISEGNGSLLAMGVFKEFTYLKLLRLNKNNIYYIKPGTFLGLTSLTSLDISNNSITSIDANSFLELHSLEVLIAMDISLQTIEEKAFDGLKMLQLLVLIRRSLSSQSAVDVKDGALTDLVRLEKLYVDDHRLCCEFKSSIGLDVSNCFTTERQPPLNLCGSLMRNNFLRVSMWILGLSALVGNAAVIIRRCCQGKEKGGKRTHSFFVLNLAVSDFMMGVYMLMIAGADVYFGNKYSREAREWRSSPICKIAGVISVLSSEASVFFVTLISLDSFYSIVFPFSRTRLGEKSAAITVASLWLLALSLSVVPTVLVSSDSRVYGLSDVCIGLPLLTKPTSYDLAENKIDMRADLDPIKVPVGRGKEPAWIYSIILFLGVNLLCFLVVLYCYIAIFVKVKRTASRVRRMTHRDQEIKTAVKMALIVGTDFACWMPVIIMGILSQTGVVDISLDMYAWTVVFILPINSSLNPYMYTFYTTLASRRNNQGARFSTEMKTKSLETVHSMILGK
ncbi:uncharacterized protein LOC110985962 isoform X2 [Acanthaster planci]|uniref:Uncharacterized protein LOC110985962 isoform X2 n=1 Tax=Acanthaster planci TaxID=133434 RepID=A0A8B7ZDW8_ACAPL|nr:uncharacterized protein LOC110985962 isoform X2 [Acanthaster planci]